MRRFTSNKLVIASHNAGKIREISVLLEPFDVSVIPASDLGLAEMTRKRIGEGLLESLSSHCPHCEGSGHILDNEILAD